MRNALILISTPSQAFFLSQTPDVTRNSVLVITVKSPREAEKILALLAKFEWKEIQIWKVPHADDKLVYFKLLQVRLKITDLQLKYPHFSEVYFGSYANLVHLSIVGVYENKARLTLLYDGLQLVSVNHFRNIASNENRKNFPKVYKILGFKQPKISKLTYCSPLPMEVEGNDSIEVLLREEPKRLRPVDENLIYFIGQPLPDLGMISSDYYIGTIKKLQKILSKRIIYFPHPRENEGLINSLKKDFEIRMPETIFEEYYLQLEKVPGTVISFYSSVLANLVYLKSPSNIIAIEIPAEEIKGNRFQKLISPIYIYFNKISSTKFTVLNGEKI